jgi:hypothetical protein
MVSIALCLAIEPWLRVPGAVVVGDDGVKGAVLLALEADVVTGRADERTPEDNRSRLRTHVTLVALEVLGCLVDFHLYKPRLYQRLH